MQINSTTVKDPKYEGIMVTDEAIWSSNTGRSSTGKMIGDIVAMKTTIEVSWSVLTYSELKTIRDAIISGGEFFTITYPDIEAGINSDGTLKTQTKTVYCANIPRLLASTSAKFRRYTDITIQFIER